MKKLYYNSMEREFYFVTKRPKTILIEWATCRIPETYDGKGDVISYLTMDYNLQWVDDFTGKNKMIVSLFGKNKKHCLKEYSEDYILIYPYQGGQPFALELATVESINYHKSYEYSHKINEYYDNLLKYIGG